MREKNRRTALRGEGRALLLALCACLLFAASPRARQQRPADTGKPARDSYRIDLRLNFDERSYAGTERVRWTNRDTRPASALYFHLYPNLRAEPRPPQTETTDDELYADEPRLDVTRAVLSGTDQPLALSYEDGGATMRVQLREPVASGASVEVELSFRGSFPEIDSDETSLPAHLVQQVGAAMRDTRDLRRARDTNFSSRGVMLLASPHPLLAAREGGDWRRGVEPSVADTVFADAADYEVRVSAPRDVAVFSSAESVGGAAVPTGDAAPSTSTGDAAASTSTGGAAGGGTADGARLFRGESLRSFALVAGRALRSEEREAAPGLRVRTVYRAEHESTGRRVLSVAAEAARAYAARFGPLPFGTVTVAEAPLVAGLGSADFAGLAVIASAFYVDFDSPSLRGLPEIVREHRASVEDSLEFAAAEGVAAQWWGAAVGGDPARAPVSTEALSQWSALLYVQDVHGAERARLVEEDQLRGVYQVYRTFGGEDLPADRPAREYRNSFQYAAVVAGKGALMLVALRQLLGEQKFFKALRAYYEAHRLGAPGLEDLRAAFIAEADVQQRRLVARTFTRWLSERRGDEDIAPPNPELTAAVGLTPGVSQKQPQPPRDRNALSRLGRFFWRQMTRIR